MKGKCLKWIVIMLMLTLMLGIRVYAGGCYQEATKRQQALISYLNEIYVQKYPQLGLSLDYGTPSDRAKLKQAAKEITSGVQKTEQKIKALYDWIDKNIIYDTQSMASPAEVYNSRHGDCLGIAVLLCEFLRMENIPAVFSDGMRGDMVRVVSEDTMKNEVGHAWVYVYLNGQWQLLDPLFDTYMPSQEEIYQWYYPWYTEGVVPYYNGMNMKLLDGTYYINGNFMQYRNGMMIHEYYGLPGGEIWINSMQGISFVCRSQYNEQDTQDGYQYVDGRKEEKISSRLYTNGWIHYGDTYNFCKANGMLKNQTIETIGGKQYYFNYGGDMSILTSPSGNVELYGGYPIIRKGETLQMEILWTPNEGTTLKWESSDTEVATVDNTGRITAHSNGYALITCSDMLGDTFWHSSMLEVCVVSPLKEISVNKTQLSLQKGSSQQLSAYVDTEDTFYYGKVYWTSSNEAVATVDHEGNVLAIAPGTAEIRANSYNGTVQYASCMVTVEKETLDERNMGESDEEETNEKSQDKAQQDTEKTSQSEMTQAVSKNGTIRATNNTITISWKQDENATSGYRIYVKYKNKFIKLGSTKERKTSFTIRKIKGKSLQAGKTYTAKVVSLKKVKGKVKEGRIITLKTSTRPKTSTITYGKKRTSTKILLKWKKITGVTGYEIQMSTNAKKGFKKIAAAKASKRSFLKGGLRKGKTYYFRIRSYKKVTGGKIYSSWSRVKKIK